MEENRATIDLINFEEDYVVELQDSGVKGSCNQTLISVTIVEVNH